MVRYSIVRCFGLGAVLVAAALAPAFAYAQDRTTDDRLDRIERDLNMLERQVYRGAPTSSSTVPAAPGPSTAADIEIRMERLESAMRDLTGRVEEITNGLDQLKQRVEQINSDFDVRFNQLSGTPSAAATPPSTAAMPRIAAGPAPPGGLMPPGTVVPPPTGGGLNPIFNTLTPPGTAPARPQAAQPATAAGPLPAGSANEQFNYAFGLVKQADYPGAEAALKAFVEAHPNDPLAGNAQYWLGETYYARDKYMEAAAAFAEGYKRYPKGSKAADDLLKLGMSLARADQKKNACLALAQLDQAFPNPAAAIKERSNAEKKRIGCS
jgi:tol-pal system protein YbgF